MDAIFTVAAARPDASRPAGQSRAGRPAARGPRSPVRRRAFTLIEMLTVVVIIGILASLITGAVIAARRAARIAIVAVELNQLDAALKAYKQKYGEYPPDCAGVGPKNPDDVRIPARQAVFRHLTRAYPRYTPPGSYDTPANTDMTWVKFSLTIYRNYGLDINRLDPSAALVFWLGGLPRGVGSKELIGFSANPRDPFDVGDGKNRGSRQAPLFEFKQDRLNFDDKGVCRYFPDTGGTGANAPYVYFRATNGIYGLRAPKGGYVKHPGFYLGNPDDHPHPEWGSTGPCLDTRRPRQSPDPTGADFEWINGDTFQIRAAGLDGKFGSGVMYPSGEDYVQGNDEATFDDQTDFSEGGTLEKRMQ